MTSWSTLPRPDAPSAPEDVVGDRSTLVVIGMVAVFIACAVFGALRFVAHLVTGLATPWWGNATGVVAITLLFLWHRRAPDRRSSFAVHGTALVATVALLVPSAYGMSSSKWWLSLVGFSVLLMGRRREALLWGPLTILLVPLTALLEPSIRVPNAIGESSTERAMAGLFYVLLLLGVTWSFRRVSERRAKELAETAASLERANRVKGRFLAHMSHEIRTPLHGVIAMTDLARSGEASTEVQHQIEAAQQSARVLLGLLNNLLDVTRAEADALELDRQPFSLHAALTDVVRPLSAQATNKGLELLAHAEPGLLERRVGDRVRVGQIVMNLVGNALKFTTSGRIALDLRAVAGDDELVSLEVSDTGAGIRPDQLERIFEPFIQADAADARLQGGAGLGLAIVRELAHAMGGTVRVDSVLGRGSTFVVRLRLPRAPDAGTASGPEDLLPPFSEPTSARPATARRALRVLACEDNDVSRRVLTIMLRQLGHDATIVPDGAAAWEALQDREFDVLLTDVEMPVMDGLELTRRVRDREKAKGGGRLRVIGATAHVGEAERHRLIALDMDAHLPKPFTLAHLSAMLTETLDKPAVASLDDGNVSARAATR
jgi:signal transduction histidine kinase